MRGWTTMHFLERERAELRRLLPGLDEALATAPLDRWEQPGHDGLDAFRAAGGPGLLVSVAHGGSGADLLAATRVQRAVGARSPSLAVATTMHHFSVASVVEAAAQGDGPEWMLLAAIAKERLLLASGFAEGRTGAHILSPGLTARVDGDKAWLSGSKKPCSLARSMDLLTASFAAPDPNGGTRTAVALVPAESPGLSVRPFWNSPILAGAESDEVVLDDVEVPAELIAWSDATSAGDPDRLQTVGFVWFELLITAAYLGAASALVERVLAAGVADTTTVAGLVTDIEAAALTVEGVAREAGDGPVDNDALGRALFCRFHVQDVIRSVADRAAETLGGMAFVGSGDVAYLGSACRALAYHPPSRARMAPALVCHAAGEPLRVP